MFRFSFPQLFTFGPFNPFGACMNVPSFNNFWMPGWSGMTTPPSIFASMPPYPQYSAASMWQMGTVNNMSMYPGLCLGGASPASTSRTAEEKSNEKKLSDLKAVAREVIKNLSGDSRVTLQTAIDKNDGTVLERVTALENALKANKSEVEKVLLNPPTTLKAGNKTLAKVLEELCLKSNLQNSNVQIMNGALAGSDDINKEEVASLGITKSNVLAYIEKMGSFEYFNDSKNECLLKAMHEALADVAKAVIDNNEVKPELQNAVSDIWVEYNNDKSAATLDSFKQLYAATLLAVSELADRKTQGTLDGVVSSNFYTDRAKNLLTKAGISEDSVNNITEDNASTNGIVKDDVYEPLDENIVKIEFKEKDLQNSHNQAAKIIAEVFEKKDNLEYEISADYKQITAKCGSKKVQLSFDEKGEISEIIVHQGSRKIGAYKKDKETYCLAVANKNESITPGQFSALADKCKPLVDNGRKKMFSEGFESVFRDDGLKNAYSEVQGVLNHISENLGNINFEREGNYEGQIIEVNGKKYEILIYTKNSDNSLSRLIIKPLDNDKCSYIINYADDTFSVSQDGASGVVEKIVSDTMARIERLTEVFNPEFIAAFEKK